MNTQSLVFALFFGALAFNPFALAMSFPPEVSQISLEGKLNCPYISSHGGTAYLQILLSSPDIVRSGRRQMNIAVVLDRSGSMADAGKIEYARQALLKIIDQLGSEDIFSLVIYDDVIEVLKSAGRVGTPD